MSWGKISLRPADSLFSLYLRTLIGHCEVCGKQEGLQASHYFGRRNENTRFSLENVDCLCARCHRKFHEKPHDYTEWKKKKLGEKRYALLVIAANTYKKRDDKMERLRWREALKTLKV